MPGTEHAGRLHLVAVGAAPVLVAGSCGGRGAEGPSAGAGAGAGLSPEVCDLVSDLERIELSLRAPEVFDRDAAQLGATAREERTLLARIAPGVGGDLRRRLRERLLWQRAVDEAIVERWDSQRVALAAEHDDGAWVPRLLDATVRRSDGTEISTAEFGLLASSTSWELVVRCRAPELVDGPREETSEDPPPGRLMFVRSAGGDHDKGETRELATADPRDGSPIRLAQPAPWEAFSGLEPGPSGHELALGARQGDEHGLVIVDDSGRALRVAAHGPTELTCTSWSDAGDRVLALPNTSDADERRLQLIDLTGGGSVRPLDIPLAVVGCAAFTPGDRLVVADAAPAIDGDRGVWTVGLNGSDPRELYSPEGCRTQVGDVDPAGSRVAVSQSCTDPEANGLWVVNLATGAADHIVTALTGPAKWSPDGHWLVFGLSPIVGTPTSTIWVVRADGRQLRQVIPEPSWTPVWLPPA